MKKIGYIFAILFTVLLLCLGVIYLATEQRIQRPYEVAAHAIIIPADNAALIEGARLFVTRGCSDCHGADGSGAVVIDDPAVGQIMGTNLTAGAGGVAGNYEPATMARAIRHGIRHDNQPLLFMPAHEFQGFSDEDVGLLIAHIRNLSPVDQQMPPSKPGILGRILFMTDQLALVPAELVDHNQDPPDTMPVEATAAYGEYLAQGCTGCHGPGFSGGAIPGAPPDWLPAANITQDETTGLGRWNQTDFMHALRTGVRPDGSTIDSLMPWKNFGQMNDVELEALWLYLQTVPVQTAGNR